MDLLKDYSSESDIETGTDSQSEQEEDKLPLLPPSLLDKYHIEPSVNKKKRTLEDMNKGRIWTSFIYLDWRVSPKDRNTLNQYLSLCNDKFTTYGIKFKPSFYLSFGAPINLHLTLSPNLLFPTEIARDKFFSHLQGKLLERPGWSDRTVPLQTQPALLKTSNGHTTFLTLQVTKDALDSYIRPIFRDINAVLSEEQLCNISNIPESFIQNAHVSIAKTWSTQLPSELRLPPLNATLAIPSDHRIQYDRNRESLTLELPKRERV